MEQPELGQTGMSSAGLNLQWSWERGWHGHAWGRRSGGSLWLRAPLSIEAASTYGDLLSALLEHQGAAYEPDPF